MCVCILKTIFFSAAAINVYILRPVCICVAYARARLLLYFTKYKTHTDAIVCASYLYTFSIFIAYYEWQSMRILNIIKKRMKIWALVEVGKIAQFEMVLLSCNTATALMTSYTVNGIHHLFYTTLHRTTIHY